MSEAQKPFSKAGSKSERFVFVCLVERTLEVQVKGMSLGHEQGMGKPFLRTFNS